MLGFLAAFLVKLPALILHNWLPDAHTEAPTAGSLILAGLLLKTGAYGLLRFIIPLFPSAAALIAPACLILGVAGILYGALLAFAQSDLKRLVAYTSVSHMGFILTGVFTFNELAYRGVIIQIIAHGLSTGGLFVLVGQMYERIHTRDLNRAGGLWKQVPVMGAAGMIFAMASLGLPGLGNFIAEFLILTGTFKTNPVIACLAATGLIFATLYSLLIIQKVFHGESRDYGVIKDLDLREKVVSGLLVIPLFWIGLFPRPFLDLSGDMVRKILSPAVQKFTGRPQTEKHIRTFTMRAGGPGDMTGVLRTGANPGEPVSRSFQPQNGNDERRQNPKAGGAGRSNPDSRQQDPQIRGACRLKIVNDKNEPKNE
jgi:NADH-quinone oxidoreductase subunit M